VIRRATIAVALGALILVSASPPPAAAQDDTHRMGTVARYLVDPDERAVEVDIEIDFTNTAPDPPGQFSVFEVIDLAIHDAAEEVVARDADGELDVSTQRQDEVHIATITLREPLRYEETVSLELEYRLPDGGDGGIRVGPSLVVFPAWSFGTSGEVSIELPAEYDVRVDGDTLEAEQGEQATRLTSGEVSDPTRWLALVTAYRLGEYVTIERSIPLVSGTVDLRIRAFVEDEAWGERIRELLVAALPRLEEAIGLPYERSGPLVIVESPPAGVGAIDEEVTAGGEILVAYDAAPFTVLHQVSHVWTGTPLFGERWIREGLASYYAGVVAAQLDIEPPFDPAERAAELDEAAIPLTGWGDVSGTDDPEAEAYGYAASWSVFEEVASVISPDEMRSALARIHSGIDA
jgi:hypothetical protein